MNFRKWLEASMDPPSLGDFMNWANKREDHMYSKGVKDAQDDNYDPPGMGSPLSSDWRFSYMLGWRAMGKRIPPGKTSRSSLSDREWFAMKLREKRYAAASPDKYIDATAAQDPKWNDPDYNPEEG